MKQVSRLGEIVVFRKRKEPSLGMVLRGQDGKVVVFSEEGKEMEVNPERVVLSTGITLGEGLTQSERKLELRKLRRELEERKNSIDLKTLWECVCEFETELPLKDLMDLYFSGDEIEDRDLLLFFWAIDKDDIYFKRGEGGYIPRSKEEIKEVLVRKEQEHIKRLRHEAALKWAKSIIEGNIEPERSSDFANYLELIKGYVIYRDKFERVSEARSFLAEIGIKDFEGAIEFLIKAGSWKEDDDPLLMRLGLNEGFPEDVLREAENIIKKPLSLEGVEDLTHLETYSIDDDTTEDIDDAISITESSEGLMVGVHIADVGSLIPKWSLLDQEALRRGETIYLPEGNIHMFPLELVRSRLSLFEGTPRFAISLLILFDNNLSIKSYRFTKSKILVRKNLSYSQAEDFLKSGHMGCRLVEIALNLRRKRIEAGAFIVELPDLKIGIREDGSIEIKKIYMNTIAHLVVSEFMILTNWLSARFFKDRGIPAIFRSQPEPVSEEAKELDENDPLFPLRVVKFLKPSRMGLSPEPHSFLGLDAYVQITSPIRRYLDLVLQRQLLSELEGREPCYTVEELERIYFQVESSVREKRIVERARERYWLLKYLKGMEGRYITGVVSSLRESTASVYLPDYLLEVPVSVTSGLSVKEEDVVKLKVERVDPLRRRIFLNLESKVE
ncbi:MAG: ribonuclease [Deltaproteobacteria bacterium]|nr:MAG: ribonuclease [Deltaproteobacteria bacterium]